MLKNKINKYQNKYEQVDNFTIKGFTRNGNSFLIDKEDYPLVKPYCWHRHQDGYMRTRISHYIENGKLHNSYILMHNLIMSKKEGLEIDHLNGNPADNRKCNLKYKTHAENMDNIVGYTGNKINDKGDINKVITLMDKYICENDIISEIKEIKSQNHGKKFIYKQDINNIKSKSQIIENFYELLCICGNLLNKCNINVLLLPGMEKTDLNDTLISEQLD